MARVPWHEHGRAPSYLPLASLRPLDNAEPSESPVRASTPDGG